MKALIAAILRHRRISLSRSVLHDQTQHFINFGYNLMLMLIFSLIFQYIVLEQWQWILALKIICVIRLLPKWKKETLALKNWVQKEGAEQNETT